MRGQGSVLRARCQGRCAVRVSQVKPPRRRTGAIVTFTHPEERREVTGHVVAGAGTRLQVFTDDQRVAVRCDPRCRTGRSPPDP